MIKFFKTVAELSFQLWVYSVQIKHFVIARRGKDSGKSISEDKKDKEFNDQFLFIMYIIFLQQSQNDSSHPWAEIDEEIMSSRCDILSFCP